jgi:hypothetical protein
MKSPNVKKNSLEVDATKLNKMIVEELGEEALNWRVR